MTSFQLVTLDFWENVYNNVSYLNPYLLVTTLKPGELARKSYFSSRIY